MRSDLREDLDCLVIGGGAAGLTAAIYLARYHLSDLSLIAGRAALIWFRKPVIYRFPEGISGPDFLELARRQAARYGGSASDG